MTPTPTVEGDIVSALIAASGGDPVAIERFFQRFFTQKWVVPSRHQSEPISNAVQPESELVTLLAVQDGERAVVPLFSCREFADEWAGRSLEYIELSGLELVRRIPATWWGWVNLGQEWSKELSPWEIERLQSGGAEAIPELVSDLSQSEEPAPPTFAPLTAEQEERLRGGIERILGGRRDVVQVQAVQQFENESAKSLRRLIVGVELCGESLEHGELRETLAREFALAQIGAEPTEVVLSGSLGWKIYADAFRTGTLLLKRNELGLFAALRRWFGR